MNKYNEQHATTMLNALQGTDTLKQYAEQIRADERINTVQFIIDEFNRRTVCLGRATAKTYVINTLNEILKELKEKKKNE